MTDPSLKYHKKYLKYELLYSEELSGNVRYLRHEGTKIRPATVDGMAEMDVLLDPAKVCRASVRYDSPTMTAAEKSALAANAKMVSNLRKRK